MRRKLVVAAAALAVVGWASPAVAQGGIPGGGAGSVPTPPGLSLVTNVGASSIPVNSGAPMVDTTLITNNTGLSQLVSLSYSVSTDQLSSSCQMAPWAGTPVLVNAGSTVGVTTKAAAPGCTSLYTLSVNATTPSGDAASAQAAWSQYLPKRR